MGEFLSRLNTYLDAVLVSGPDYLDKAADAFHSLADFIRQLGPGFVVGSSAPDAGELDRLVDKAKEAESKLKGGGETGPDGRPVAGAFGPGALLLLQIVLAVLEQIRKRQDPAPAGNAAPAGDDDTHDHGAKPAGKPAK
jgi:hypothetical protein